MRGTGTRTLVTGLCLGLVTFAIGSLSGASASASTALPANVLPGLSHLSSTGDADPNRVLTVGVAIAHPDPAGEDAALTAMYDPSSPSYHHFLSPESFARRFGVDPQATEAVTRWLGAGGAQVLSVAAAGDLVMARMTTTQADGIFQVHERSYRSGSTDFVANDAAPRVPAGLNITTVMGLNTWQHAAPLNPQIRASSPQQCTPAFCAGTLQPEDLWSLYDMPANLMGQGQKIAIFGEGVLGSETHKGDVLADLRQYEDEHHFPHMPITVHCVISNNCGTDTSGSGEWDLDEDAATGMAPMADHLDFYFAQDLTDADQAAMIGAWLSDAAAPLQANASFAECEQGPYNGTLYGAPGNVDGNGGITASLPGGLGVGPTGHQLGDNLEAYAEPALKSAAMMGRSLFAGAGDTGSGCTAIVADGLGPNGVAWEPFPTIGYPNGARYAVSVGGTVIYTSPTNTHTRFQEYAWPYTGGGSSPFLTAPDYQSGVAAVAGTCVSDANGGTGDTGKQCRGVPDIAALSGDLTTGYAVVGGGSDGTSGGTSLSGPLMAGAWTRLQQASGAPGGNGFANYTYYAIGKNSTRYAKDFYDITVGSNGPGYCPPSGCVAQAGWDYTSGWGVPDVGHIASELSAPATQAAPPPAQPTSGSVQGVSTRTLPNTSGPAPALPAGPMLLALAGPLAAALGRRRFVRKG
ncbi:MAG: S53 family peptidase [Candidatus Dormibacteria bacterium]